MFSIFSCCLPKQILEKEPEIETKPLENVASWGHTFSHISEFTYIWTVHNFSHRPRTSGEFLDSPAFMDNEGRTKWNLRIYPGGRGPDHKDHISLHLCLLNSSILKDGLSASKEVNAKLKVAILNEEKHPIWEIAFTGTRGFQPKNAGTNWGWHRFMAHDVIFDESKGFLPGDKLIIHSHVSMVASVVATAGIVPLPPSTLADDFSAIQNDSKFSDVTLKVENRQFRAHRIILAARSPVFRAMFSHNMQETKNNEVVIKDIEANVMEELLRFIYTEKINNKNKIAKQLMIAADKYAIESLKIHCESAMLSLITPQNVSEMLILADMHRCSHLKEATLSIIRRIPDQVINTQGWNDLVESHPSLVADIIVAQQQGLTSLPVGLNLGLELTPGVEIVFNNDQSTGFPADNVDFLSI